MLSEYITWEIPGLKGYGLFHFFFIGLTILFSWLLIRKGKEHDSNKQVKVVFIIGLIFLFLELFKQLYYNDLSFKTPYTWWLFPFQLCSTPMYFCLLIPLFSEEFRKKAYSFLAFYGFVGGLAVYVIPSTVIVDDVLISIQSLTWHGLQIILGCYLIKTQDYGHTIKEMIPGIAWFVVLTLCAMSMNFVFEICKNAFDIDSSFNMFYISPYYESRILVLGDIWRATNWFIALICYFIGVSLGASIIWGGAYLYKKYHVIDLNEEKI